MTSIERIKFYLRRHDIPEVYLSFFERYLLRGSRDTQKIYFICLRDLKLAPEEVFVPQTKTENRMNFNIDLCPCNIFHILLFPLFLVSRQLWPFLGTSKISSISKLPFISILLHFPNSSAVIKGNYSEHR